MSSPAVAAAPEPPPDRPRRSSLPLLVAGVLGRSWLWFVAGCVVITLVPILFGWRPYLVLSGSMEPRIRVGDVVLAAPVSNSSDLLGRVTVFADPAKPSTYKTHRVIAVNTDGTLTTKGDANPTVDSTRVPFSDVRGLGRLLVSFAGLPLIWARSGQWDLVLLFLASLVLAALAVSRDRDDDVEADSDDDGPPGGQLLTLPTRVGGSGSSTIAASTPLEPGVQMGRPARPDPKSVRGFAAPPVRRVRSRPALRALYVGVLAAAVAVPTTSAAFAATTKNTADSWAAGSWTYTSMVTGLSPWLYWKLDETTGTVAADSSGNNRTGTYTVNGAASTAGVAQGVVGGLANNTPNLGVTLNGTTACINTASTTATAAPVALTEIVWFKTTTTNGGKLLGFETPRTGVAVAGSGGTYDRMIYLDGAGKVSFAVYNAGYFTISSSSAYNDGTWHMAAASLGSGGMSLWVDGVLVGTNANTAGEATTGWFRAGCGNLAGWGGSWAGPNNPTTSTNPAQNRPFAGSLDEVTVWTSALTAAQITALWAAH